MFEAILYLGFALNTTAQSMSAVRYPSVEQCELAKEAMLNNLDVNPHKGSFMGWDMKAVCVPVKKAD